MNQTTTTIRQEVGLLEAAIREFMGTKSPVFLISERERQILKDADKLGVLTRFAREVFEQIDLPSGKDLRAGVYYVLNPNAAVNILGSD